MHAEAYAFVKQFSTDAKLNVIEIGSRNINGTVRGLFPNTRWIGLDLHDGPAVDVVCDMLDYTPVNQADIVICCEVLEHAIRWPDMVKRAAEWVKPGGAMIITCAGPGRAPHSHIDGCQLRPQEYYGNVTTQDLKTILEAVSMQVVICCQCGHDTQAMALKPA